MPCCALRVIRARARTAARGDENYSAMMRRYSKRRYFAGAEKMNVMLYARVQAMMSTITCQLSSAASGAPSALQDQLLCG